MLRTKWLPVNLADDVPATLPPQVRLLLGDARSLAKQVNYERLPNPIRWQELLSAIVDAGQQPDGLAPAAEKLKEAQAKVRSIRQGRSRRRYATGVLLGLAIAAIAGWVLIAPAARTIFPSIADADDVAGVVVFGALGSFASVMTRLEQIETADDTPHWLITTTAIARPVVAIIFAGIAFIILKNGLIAGVGCKSSTGDNCKPILWVAEFLSGFTERFAPDLIGRVSFGGGAPRATDPKETTPPTDP